MNRYHVSVLRHKFIEQICLERKKRKIFLLHLPHHHRHHRATVSWCLEKKEKGLRFVIYVYIYARLETHTQCSQQSRLFYGFTHPSSRRGPRLPFPWRLSKKKKNTKDGGWVSGRSHFPQLRSNISKMKRVCVCVPCSESSAPFHKTTSVNKK